MNQFPLEVGQYIRVGEFTVDEVLQQVVDPSLLNTLKRAGVKKHTPEHVSATERSFDGHMVKMTSQRYQLFNVRGVTCVGCGIVGEFFGLERVKGQEGQRYHFNLYGMRDGQEVLITKDHVIPKSKGGANALYNYQVMCLECNMEKADTLK